ncbi:MAG: hypothetical protein NTW21_06940 [Verrucomicrobia bacterium]|nr:hypothetical protein [Verrucomicrobiota bacterium]
MNLRTLQLGLAAAMLLATPASAVQINWGSPVDSVLVDSSGKALGTGLTDFTIELGAFVISDTNQGAWVPNTTNVLEWANHWRVFDQAGFAPELGLFTSTAVLETDGTSGSFPLSSVDFSSRDAYMWIYDTKTSHSSEWFLGRNTDWVFPAKVTPPTPAVPDNCCDKRPPIEWSVSDLKPSTVQGSGDLPLYGNQGNVNGPGVSSPAASPPSYYVQTAYGAVPEPGGSVLVLVLGLLAVLDRRRVPCH